MAAKKECKDMMEEDEEGIDHSLYPPLNGNELFERWKMNRSTLPGDFSRLFDPTIEEQHRGDLFEAEDEEAMEKYAWAIPDERALTICAHFGKPAIESPASSSFPGLLSSQNAFLVTKS